MISLYVRKSDYFEPALKDSICIVNAEFQLEFIATLNLGKESK